MRFHATIALVMTPLSACGETEPRSQLYFEAHIDEARDIVQQCQEGSVRGGECTNAEWAVSEAAAKERRKRFLGDGKAYMPR